MKRHLLAIACILAGTFGAPAAFAGPIDGACMKSGRTSNPQVCGCIQRVADQTLNRSDQRRAAGFFKNPDEAQDVRMSTRPSDNDFWLRYKNFATTAEAYCAG